MVTCCCKCNTRMPSRGQARLMPRVFKSKHPIYQLLMDFLEVVAMQV